MRKAQVFMHGVLAGEFIEVNKQYYRFCYDSAYQGPPISLTMPLSEREYEFTRFPPFFDGVLPEGIQLEALLRKCKLDKTDYFGQLVQVGKDLVGAVTVEVLI